MCPACGAFVVMAVVLVVGSLVPVCFSVIVSVVIHLLSCVVVVACLVHTCEGVCFSAVSCVFGVVGGMVCVGIGCCVSTSWYEL